MAGRYKLTNPLEITREVKKPKDGPSPKVETEDDDKPASSSESNSTSDTITERPVLVPLKDKEVMQSIGLLRQYLRDTGLNANMNKFTAALLQNNVLPYNPYPGYARRFSKVSEKFHTRRESLVQVQRRISQCPTFVTGTGVLSGVKLPDAKLWGLQHILTGVNPKVLDAYRNLVKNATVAQQRITQKVGDNASIMTTLKGPCIFSGSLHNKCYKINIGVCFLIRSSDLAEAAKNFGKAVVCDLEKILKDTNHQVLSLYVPIIDGDVSQKRDWSGDELRSALTSETSQSRNDLIQAIGASALKKQNCIVQLLLNCEKDVNIFKTKHIRAAKSYNFMALLISPSQTRIGAGQSPLHISTVPYNALHEGIFLDQTEAELYLSTFKKFSSSKAPLSQEVSTAVQTVWQGKVAGRQLESELSLLTHYEWLIERIQNQAKAAMNKKEESLAIEICRMLQGFGVKLESMITLVTTLYEITDAKISVAQPQVFSDMFHTFQSDLLEFFNEESHELTIAFAKPVVTRTIWDIESLSKEKSFDKIQPLLNFLKGYLKALSISLTDDALDEFPAIKNIKSQIDTVTQTEFGRDLNVDLRPDAFRHKSDATTHTDIDRKQIDVSVSAANLAAPPKIAQQVSRMQYCMDIRIDEVWKEFLQNVLIVRESLPPNPYPMLISLLRQASLKVQLFREDNTAILRKLLSAKPREYDENFHLHSIPGISAYGSYEAVSPLNPTGFRQISAMASTVAISTPQTGSGAPTVAAGSFEIKCLMAVSGGALFFGSASPFLTSIDTHEYCLVKGPKVQEGDGILALAKIILIYLSNLQSQGILPIKVAFSDGEIELNDLNGASARFQNQFVAIANTRQPIVVHLLMPLEWRYVSIKKTIHVYYINEMNDEVRMVTEHNPGAYFRQVFLNGLDAAEYTRRIRLFEKVPKTFLEVGIHEAWEQYDWITVAQLGLSWSLKAKSIENLDKTATETATFCWKLLHSPFGLLLYCMSLNSALSDGIQYKSSGSAEANIKERLKTMLFGYRNCLHNVLTSQSTMASRAINPYCQDLLQRIAPCDITSGVANMSNESQLSAALAHILGLTQAVADSIAFDLVHCVPSVLSLTNKAKKNV